jgi:hypothetical protein
MRVYRTGTKITYPVHTNSFELCNPEIVEKENYEHHQPANVSTFYILIHLFFFLFLSYLGIHSYLELCVLYEHVKCTGTIYLTTFQ